MLRLRGLEPARAHQGDRTEDVLSDEFLGLQCAGRLPRVVPELEDNLALFQRVAHQLGLGQSPRESLFAVDVFACFHGVEHHLAVPMVRRRDDHRIHVPVSQEFTVIHVRFRFRVQAALNPLLPMRPINIADRHDLDVRRVSDRINEVSPAGAQADAAHANHVAGGGGGEKRRSETGRGGERRSRLAGGAQKLTAVEDGGVVHRYRSFCS
jgi:hypothetical protein